VGTHSPLLAFALALNRRRLCGGGWLRSGGGRLELFWQQDADRMAPVASCIVEADSSDLHMGTGGKQVCSGLQKVRKWYTGCCALVGN